MSRATSSTLTRTSLPITTRLRHDLALTYLSALDVIRAFETQQQTTTEIRRERLRAELAAVDVVPLTNPADQRW